LFPDGFQGDREGIAIYTEPGGRGNIVCTDQITGGSAYYLFRWEGASGNPHDHAERAVGSTVSPGPARGDEQWTEELPRLRLARHLPG